MFISLAALLVASGALGVTGTLLWTPLDDTSADAAALVRRRHDTALISTGVAFVATLVCFVYFWFMRVNLMTMWVQLCSNHSPTCRQYLHKLRTIAALLPSYSYRACGQPPMFDAPRTPTSPVPPVPMQFREYDDPDDRYASYWPSTTSHEVDEEAEKKKKHNSEAVIATDGHVEHD